MQWRWQKGREAWEGGKDDQGSCQERDEGVRGQDKQAIDQALLQGQSQ